MNCRIPVMTNVSNTRIKHEVTQTIDLRAGEKCYKRTWSSKRSGNDTVGQSTTTSGCFTLLSYSHSSGAA